MLLDMLEFQRDFPNTSLECDMIIPSNFYESGANPKYNLPWGGERFPCYTYFSEK
jgi:hypothetical protein